MGRGVGIRVRLELMVVQLVVILLVILVVIQRCLGNDWKAGVGGSCCLVTVVVGQTEGNSDKD